MENLLTAGKIVNTHALRGEVRVYPYCDSAEFLCEFDRLFIGGAERKVRAARVHKGQALLSLEGVDTVEQAQALVGSIVQIDKNDVELEEGRYFIEDIIGLTVVDALTGQNYGKITNVIETGANDVFEVTDADGRVRLVPKIDDVVKAISLTDGVVSITPLRGLFE